LYLQLRNISLDISQYYYHIFNKDAKYRDGLSGTKVVEGREMFGNKKSKVMRTKESVCEVCGLDCYDKDSLARHMDWAHKEQKGTPKS
jgi:hypothetical protein